MLNESGACVAWDQYDPHIFTYVIVAWNPAKFSLSAFICSGLSFLKQRLFCPGTAATTASLRVHMLVSCGGRLLQIYNPKITSSSTYMSDNMFSDVHPWKYILFNMILNNFIYITYLYEGILNFIRVWHFLIRCITILYNNVIKTSSLRSTQSLQWANSIKIPLMFT